VTDTPAGPPAGTAPGAGPTSGRAYAEYIAPPSAAGPSTAGPSTAGSPAAGPGAARPSAPGRGPRPGWRWRRRPRWRAAFFALAAVAIIVGVAWALLGDRVFVVRSITVTGTHLVSPATVIAAADVPLGTPLMRVDPGAVTRRVEAIRQVASATVSEDWPDHLTIAVTERVPVLAVRMAGGGYDLIDPAGVIVSFSNAKPRGLPLFTTTLSGGALRGDPGVAAAAAVLAELTPALGRTVTTVSAVPLSQAGPGAAGEQVTLTMNGGKTVLWGSPGNGAAKDREIQILLRGTVKYVDVSAPGTAVAR
jgi:cell division protein FtsQ